MVQATAFYFQNKNLFRPITPVRANRALLYLALQFALPRKIYLCMFTYKNLILFIVYATKLNLFFIWICVQDFYTTMICDPYHFDRWVTGSNFHNSVKDHFSSRSIKYNHHCTVLYLQFPNSLLMTIISLFLFCFSLCHRITRIYYTDQYHLFRKLRIG